MSAVRQSGTYLDRITVRTAEDVRRRAASVPLDELKARIGGQPVAVSLFDALKRPGLGVIAEFKRASPSKGRFPAEIEPDDVARAYIEGGASAISCLTDEPFFQGSLADLEAVARVANAAHTNVPVLRKDFVIDSYQIHEARAFGADAILLIVACLSPAQLREFREGAETLGLEALVEAHDADEVAIALESGARIVGINNRDLRDFHVDLATTERIAPLIPAGRAIVGESGIFTAADADRLRRAGCDAVLVGESLILQPDRAQAVRSLTGA